jgi:hypothetical protein
VAEAEAGFITEAAMGSLKKNKLIFKGKRRS